MRLYERGVYHCAACYGQYEGREAVDFEAAFDGPVLNPQDVIAGRRDAVAIDDLVICDQCLEAAARLIGLVRAPDLIKALEDARAEARKYKWDNGRRRNEITKLKEALAIENEEQPEPAAA